MYKISSNKRFIYGSCIRNHVDYIFHYLTGFLAFTHHVRFNFIRKEYIDMYCSYFGEYTKAIISNGGRTKNIVTFQGFFILVK